MRDSADEENVAINGEPIVVTLGGGLFAVIWADQSDGGDAVFDLFGSIVASPAVMVRGNFLFASRSIWGDALDVRPTATRDSAGGALLFWEHSYPTPAGSPWQSTFLRGVYTQRFATFCPAAPATGCLAASPQKGSLGLKKGADVSQDSLAWKWSQGTTAADDFGDPTASTSFALCLYDGTGALTIAATAPGGSLCKGGKPCWSRAGTAPVREAQVHQRRQAGASRRHPGDEAHVGRRQGITERQGAGAEPLQRPLLAARSERADSSAAHQRLEQRLLGGDATAPPRARTPRSSRTRTTE